MTTFIREVASTGDRLSQQAALCRAADAATRASGVSTTVVRVEDKLFVARGITGKPLEDKDLRQTLAHTEGGDLWYGHVEGRGALRTMMVRVVGFGLGGSTALLAGLKLALGIDAGIAASTSIMTVLMGATIFGLSGLNLNHAKRAELELDALIKGSNAMPFRGGWTYGSTELRKRPRALTFAPGQAVPAPEVTEPARVAS